MLRARHVGLAWADTLGAGVATKILALPGTAFDASARQRKDALLSYLELAKTNAKTRNFAGAKQNLQTMWSKMDAGLQGVAADDWITDQNSQFEVLAELKNFIGAIDTASGQ